MSRIVKMYALILSVGLLLAWFYSFYMESKSIVMEGYDGVNAAVYTLDERLDEISGIAFDQARGRFLAVNDEEGKIFTLDKGFRVVAEYRFAEKGDYEDLLLHNDTILVLKSNGDIYLLKNTDQPKPYIRYYAYRGLRAEYETIFFDNNTGQYMLVSKNCSNSDKNCIYNFDPNTGNYDLLPVQLGGKNFDRKTGGSGFHPSAATCDRKGNRYILSAAEHLLVRVDHNWNAVTAYELDKRLLRQPEAITTDEQDNLYFGSEAAGRRAQILKLPISK